MILLTSKKGLVAGLDAQNILTPCHVMEERKYASGFSALLEKQTDILTVGDTAVGRQQLPLSARNRIIKLNEIQFLM